MQNDDDIIEVDDDDGEGLNNVFSESNSDSRTKDTLNGRYQIKVDHPLDNLSPLKATSFQVADKTGGSANLYCKVLDKTLPYRAHVFNFYEKSKNTNLQPLLDHGPVYLSNFGETRYVLILPKPKGRKLSEALQSLKTWEDRKIINEIVKPLYAIIETLQHYKITIGKLNTDTVFIDENGHITVEEFLSEPCGYNQNYFFETLERLACNPLGKGEGNSNVDLFALGVLIMHVGLGMNPHQEMSEEDYIANRMAIGAYNTVIGNRELSSTLEDAARGLVNDSIRDRWTLYHLENWISGRRYNIIRPSPPKESARAYVFERFQCFNLKSLSYAFLKKWNEAKTELRDPKVMRWVQLSCGKPENAENLKRVLQVSGVEMARNPAEDDEFVARALTVLDPYGPVRFKDISFYPDALGVMLADASRQSRQDMFANIKRILGMDLLSFWADFNSEHESFKSMEVTWKMDKLRNLTRIKGLGFGYERMIYELCPTLPCQSNVIKKEHVLSLDDLLAALDSRSQEKSRPLEPIDQHIAAFITNRLGIQGSIKLSGLERYPGLYNNPYLETVAMLMKCQQKAGNKPYPGLCKWLVERLIKVVEKIHNVKTKRKIMEEINVLASKGLIEPMFKLVANPEMLERDRLGFEKASVQFQRNAYRLKNIRNNSEARVKASNVAIKVSMFASYLLALVSIVIAFQKVNLGM